MCSQHIGSAVQWRASEHCAMSGRMELGVNIYPEPAVNMGQALLDSYLHKN